MVHRVDDRELAQGRRQQKGQIATPQVLNENTESGAQAYLILLNCKRPNCRPPNRRLPIYGRPEYCTVVCVVHKYYAVVFVAHK